LQHILEPTNTLDHIQEKSTHNTNDKHINRQHKSAIQRQVHATLNQETTEIANIAPSVSHAESGNKDWLFPNSI
jgi:hypothetical protein